MRDLVIRSFEPRGLTTWIWSPRHASQIDQAMESFFFSCEAGLALRATPLLRVGFSFHMAVCQNLVPLVNPKIAGKWMFIPRKMYP